MRAYAAIADERRRFYGVQFHPEVVHTPSGAICCETLYTRSRAATIPGRWRHFAMPKSPAMREQVGGAQVICGLSGGVDSAVTAVLLHEAIGDALTCIFVDHGLLREGEAEEVESLFRGALQHSADPCEGPRTLP